MCVCNCGRCQQHHYAHTKTYNYSKVVCFHRELPARWCHLAWIYLKQYASVNVSMWSVFESVYTGKFLPQWLYGCHLYWFYISDSINQIHSMPAIRVTQFIFFLSMCGCLGHFYPLTNRHCIKLIAHFTFFQASVPLMTTRCWLQGNSQSPHFCLDIQHQINFFAWDIQTK